MEKSILTIALLFAIFGAVWSQTAGYKPLGADLETYYNENFIRNKKAYIGRSVADLLNDLEVSVGSFIVVPNYNNPDYGNEFRFSNLDINTTSAVIHRNSGQKLLLLYVKFSPQIKYPTTGFIREFRGKPLTREQYAEFAKYKIVDIEVSIFPR